MPVLLDTNVLLSYLTPRAGHHGRSVTLMDRIWDGDHGVPLGVDRVHAEGLNFLRTRFGRRDLSRGYDGFFFREGDERPPLEPLVTPPALHWEARRLHFDLYDQGLSFTDCVLLAHAHHLDGSIATFDEAFQGLAPVVN